MPLLDHLARFGLLTTERRGQIRTDAQSLGFASDLCHVLQEELATDGTVRLSLLDVGARTAAGSNLIAQVFHPASYVQIKLDVTALDLEADHAEEARALYPEVRYRVGDVREVTDRFDVVTCSHTLEHLADPGAVLEHMRAIAKRLVVIAAPYKEELGPDIANPSKHLYSFGDAFFEAHGPRRLDVYNSPHWYTSDCFVAVYDPT
jgi:SAM-dependent methyltransferase